MIMQAKNGCVLGLKFGKIHIKMLVIHVGCNPRLRQRIAESRLWPVEITRSLVPLAKVAEALQVEQLSYLTIC